MKKHYVCGECKSFSQSHGNCDNEDCLQQGSPRKECSCEDGTHADIQSEWKDDPEDQPFESSKENTIDLDSSGN